MRAADHVLHARRELLQPQAAARGARVIAQVLGIEVSADELAAQHPLVRHAAGCRPGCVGAKCRRYLEPRAIDRLVDARIGVGDLGYRAAVQLVFAVERNLAGAADVAPVAIDEVVIDVAPHVVVIERAHACRQTRLRIECDDVVFIRNRRIRAAGDHEIGRGLHPIRIAAHREHQAVDRAAALLALRGSEPQARHRVRRRIHLQVLRIACRRVDADHITRVRREDLAELVSAWRRVGEFLLPVGSADTARPVHGGFEAGFIGKAHFPARYVRLLGFPLLHAALGRHGFDAGPCVAAKRIGSPVDQALLARVRRAGSQTHDGKQKDECTLHDPSSER